MSSMVSKALKVLAVSVGVLAVMGTAAAQADGTKDNTVMGLAIGAGLAVGLAGLATGLAQKDIGAAAVGAVAEDPGFLGRSIIFLALPETIVLFGLLIAFQLVGKIP